MVKMMMMTIVQRSQSANKTGGNEVPERVHFLIRGRNNFRCTFENVKKKFYLPFNAIP